MLAFSDRCCFSTWAMLSQTCSPLVTVRPARSDNFSVSSLDTKLIAYRSERAWARLSYTLSKFW